MSLEQTNINKATQSVLSALAKAEKIYQLEFPVGEILFNLRGKAAGQVRYPAYGLRQSLPEMRFNLTLLNENFDDFLAEVIPHECAHLIVFHLYSTGRLKRKTRPKPHGVEWKSVMKNVYGLAGRVTHSFDVSSGRKTNRFIYVCGCHEKRHDLSIIRHNKVQRQVSIYLCKSCSEPLEFEAKKMARVE